MRNYFVEQNVQPQKKQSFQDTKKIKAKLKA